MTISRRSVLVGTLGVVGLGALVGKGVANESVGKRPPLAVQTGIAPLDSFLGDNDDVKMAAALSYIGSQTYKPTLVLSNRQHVFANTYPLNIEGLRVNGPLGGFAREFRNQTRVDCPPGGLFSVASGFQDFVIEGLSFQGTGAFIATTTDVLTDCNIQQCGFQGFNSVYNGKITRCNFSDIYVNGATGTQFSLGGSDNVLFEGMCFLSGHILNEVPYVRFGNMSQTKVGKMYVTPTSGQGLLIDASDDQEGLFFYDWTTTAFGQTATAPPKAGIEIRGGRAITFFGGVMFNVNAKNESPGDITVTGGRDHVFDAFEFVGTHNGFTSVNLTKPAIYTTVPIVVRSPRSVGNRPKVLQQSAPNLIQCDDPTWQIVTA